MQFCNGCRTRMVDVMSFSKDANEKFCKCPRCYGETKHRKLDSKELDFGEVLDKEIHKRK